MDISTLNSASPDMSLVKVDGWTDAHDLGPQAISHHLWTRDQNYLMVSTFGATGTPGAGIGKLLLLDGNTYALDNVLPVAKGAHGIGFAGDMR